jgi:DNA mismatch repair protein MutS
LLAILEKRGGAVAGSMSAQALPLFAAAAEPDENVSPAQELPEILRQLRDINPDTLSPKQALDLLYHLKSLEPACTPEAT